MRNKESQLLCSSEQTGVPQRIALARMVTRATCISMVFKGAATFFGLATTYVFTAISDTLTYGEYIYATTWALALSAFATAGFPAAALRFIPSYATPAHSAHQAAFIVFSTRAVATLSLFCALALASAATLNVLQLSATMHRALYPASFLLIADALLRLKCAHLRAFHRTASSQFPTAVLAPFLRLVLAVIAWKCAAVPVSATTLTAAAAVASVTALLTAHLPFRSSPWCVARHRTTSGYRSSWLRTALALLFVEGCGDLLRRVDILLLGTIHGPQATGEYAIATALTNQISAPLVAANMLGYPLLASLHANGRVPELRSAARTLTFVGCAMGLPLFGLVTLYAEPLLAIFGVDTANARTPLLLLAAGQLLSTLMGPIRGLLTMTGAHNIAALILLFALIMNCVLNIVLIPTHGTTGAAIASVASTATWNVAMYAAVRIRGTTKRPCGG
jgi:O-antigen/teichoic acid export membrane protein